VATAGVKIFISQAGKNFPRVPSSSCADYKVDRLVLKAMLTNHRRCRYQTARLHFFFGNALRTTRSTS